MYKTLQDFVGNTPLVRLVRIPGAENEKRGNVLLAKLEGNNPAGSVKDRPALSMITHAEARGDIKPCDTLIEATSGNTGIALAMAAAIKGYKMILVMPENQSIERRQSMRAYGAELVLTDPPLGMKGAVAGAEEYVKSHPGSVLARQFDNAANVQAHVETTAEEIWRDTDGNVDVVVAGIGTGGTVTGVGQVLKSRNPEIQIVAVEPVDSPLLTQGTAGPHIIQGIGANFIPSILDQSVISEVIDVEGDASLVASREAASEEGLLVGISSGAALVAAKEVASRPENAGKTIVVVLPDGGERYLSTKLYEQYMD